MCWFPPIISLSSSGCTEPMGSLWCQLHGEPKVSWALGAGHQAFVAADAPHGWIIQKLINVRHLIWFCRKPAHGTFSKGPGSCRFIFLAVVIHNFLCFHPQIQEKQMTEKRWSYWLPKSQKMLHFFFWNLASNASSFWPRDGHSSLSSEISGTVGAWNIFTMKPSSSFVCTMNDGCTLDGVAWTSDVFGVVWKELALINSVFHTLLLSLLHSVAWIHEYFCSHTWHLCWPLKTWCPSLAGLPKEPGTTLWLMVRNTKAVMTAFAVRGTEVASLGFLSSFFEVCWGMAGRPGALSSCWESVCGPKHAGLTSDVPWEEGRFSRDISAAWCNLWSSSIFCFNSCSSKAFASFLFIWCLSSFTHCSCSLHRLYFWALSSLKENWFSANKLLLAIYDKLLNISFVCHRWVCRISWFRNHDHSLFHVRPFITSCRCCSRKLWTLILRNAGWVISWIWFWCYLWFKIWASSRGSEVLAFAGKWFQWGVSETPCAVAGAAPEVRQRSWPGSDPAVVQKLKTLVMVTVALGKFLNNSWWTLVIVISLLI